MNTKLIKLDINEELLETITAKQGDTKSRFILFNLYDGATPFDLRYRTVRVYGQKKDNTEVFNNLEINDAKNGYCTLELTNQMLAVEGMYELELVIFEGEKRLSTMPFILNVVGSKYSEDAIVSTNEFTALMNALKTVSNIDNKAEKKDVDELSSQLEKDVEELSSQLEKEVSNLSSQLEDIAINVINETELKNAIVNIKEGGTIQLKNDIDISTQIIFPNDIVLDGCGYKLKCITDGLQDWLCFYGKRVVIKNAIFDDNLKGRVIITGENVKKFNIINCEYTGYTKEFGYYKTDGLIRIDGGCDDILISDCKFHNSGYDYGNSDDELNRCITFNSNTIKNAVVKNCVFFKVNQGIVSNSENLTVDNCVFDYVKDNSIYTSSDILKVKDCLFSNANDEPIVTSCKINKITNNTFKDFSNKAITIYRNDGITSDIINNTFINTLDSGQCLSYRDGSYYKNITFNNNTCILSSKLYSNPYPVITTLDSEVFNFKDNYIEVNQPINSSIVLSNSKKIIFEGNILKNVGNQNIALKSTYTDAILLINNNQCEKTRIPIKGYIIGNEIEPNVSYIYNLKYNILFSEVKPNYILPKGTIVFNINYSKNTDTLCWISTGDEWLAHKINMPIKHTRSNTPINWSQPNYPGELWLGSEGSVWIGLNTDGVTTDSWKKLAD